MKKTATISIIAALAAFNSVNAADVAVSADITSDTIWSADNVYFLEGPIYVKSGATLTIQAGTIIRGQPRGDAGDAGAPGSLIVTQNGQINASGTPSSPIIFTTAAIDENGDGTPDPATTGNGTFLARYQIGVTDPADLLDATPTTSVLPLRTAGPDIDYQIDTGLDQKALVGLWGGLIILGKAPVNIDDAVNPPGTTNIEGLPAGPDTLYGGSDANDSSGILEYMSVRYGGDVLGTANEINGVTLGGVGRGTVMRFIEVYQTYDDGFEWFGGTVDAQYLVSTYVGDDAFDGDQGFTGNLQFLVGIMNYLVNWGGGNGGDKGFEYDGLDSSESVWADLLQSIPVPAPAYNSVNFTLLGASAATGKTASDNGYIGLRDNFGGGLYRGIIVNTGSEAVVQYSSVASATIGDVVYGDGAAPAAAPSSVTLLDAYETTTSGLQGEDQGVPGGVDLVPSFDVGNLTQWNADQDLPETIFVPTTYKGAIDTSSSTGNTWVDVWTATDLGPLN